MLASKLRTQLQVHLQLALETGCQTGEKPVTAQLVETVLSRQFDDLVPTLARHGYRLENMTEQFDTRAAEIRAMFSNQLEPKRSAEIRERMLAAGLPICAFICSEREDDPRLFRPVDCKPWCRPPLPSGGRGRAG